MQGVARPRERDVEEPPLLLDLVVVARRHVGRDHAVGRVDHVDDVPLEPLRGVDRRQDQVVLVEVRWSGEIAGGRRRVEREVREELSSGCGLRREELEEERRLLYVALTRARDSLVVSYPLRYYFRRNPLDDNFSHAQPSRFITPARATFAPVNVGETVIEDDPVTSELAALGE